MLRSTDVSSKLQAQTFHEAAQEEEKPTATFSSAKIHTYPGHRWQSCSYDIGAFQGWSEPAGALNKKRRKSSSSIGWEDDDFTTKTMATQATSTVFQSRRARCVVHLAIAFNVVEGIKWRWLAGWSLRRLRTLQRLFNSDLLKHLVAHPIACE